MFQWWKFVFIFKCSFGFLRIEKFHWRKCEKTHYTKTKKNLHRLVFSYVGNVSIGMYSISRQASVLHVVCERCVLVGAQLILQCLCCRGQWWSRGSVSPALNRSCRSSAVFWMLSWLKRSWVPSEFHSTLSDSRWQWCRASEITWVRI